MFHEPPEAPGCPWVSLTACQSRAAAGQQTVTIYTSIYVTYQHTQTKMWDNSLLMHIKMWGTSLNLDASLIFNIQLRQRHVFISCDVYQQSSFILALVGDQLEAAEGNLRWTGIREVWVKPRFKAEPRLPVDTQHDVIELASSRQSRIKKKKMDRRGNSPKRPLSHNLLGCIWHWKISP